MATENQVKLYELFTGQDRGLKARILRGSLAIAALGYRLAVRWRLRMYRWGIFRTRRVDKPVVSVGNITAGGTGKTPTVEWLARFIQDSLGRRPAIISRGYKTHHVFDKNNQILDVNDEGLVLRENCPGVLLIQNPDRVAAAREAAKQGADIILMDDGFQHCRLHRDLDIVLIDAIIPFGFGHVLPRGLLREPVGGLRRAHWIIITRADLVGEPELLAIEATLRDIAPNAPVSRARHRPVEFRDLHDGHALPLTTIRGKRVWLVSGIANPKAFASAVRELGATILYHSAQPDHYLFTAEDAAGFGNPRLQGKVDYFVVTQKDAVKLRRLFDMPRVIPILELRIDLALDSGEAELQGRIRQLLDEPRP